MALGERRQQDNNGADLRRRRTDQLLPPPTRKLPWPLFLLDGIGAVLLGLGAAEHFGKLPLLSRVINVPNIAVIAMGVGGVLMGFAVFGILAALKQRNPA